MKGIAKLIVSMAIMPLTITAQVVAPSDSINESKELQEVTVVGQTQTAKAGELSFIPTKKQKEIASDGYDLLRHLAMPQISVGPSSESVTTLTGGGVAIFINGLPATNNELKSLRTRNVVRVDYLDFPSDPKFQGAQHVINFVVQLPKWGGYTRLNGGGNFLTNTYATGNVFSKFIYKRMNYDLFVGYEYLNRHHIGFKQTEDYALMSIYNKPYLLEQTRTTDYTRYRVWAIPVSFRAVYSTQNFQVMNLFSFNYTDTPTIFSEGDLSIDCNGVKDYTFRNASTTNKNDLNWLSNFNLYLNAGWSLNWGTNLTYSKNKFNYLYNSDIEPSQNQVITHSDEDAWEVGGRINIRKSLSDNHSISLNTYINYNDYGVDYTGTHPFTSKQQNTNAGGTLNYSGYFPFNLNLNTRLGYGWYKSVADGETHCKAYPSVSVNASYSPNNKNQFNFDFSLSCNTPSAAMLTGDVLQNSDFLYISGNSGLDAYTSLSTNISYYWLPARNLYFGAYAYFSGSFNKIVPIFEHYKDGNALLRLYENNGDALFGAVGLSATYKPINNLQVQLQAVYRPSKVTGIIHRSIQPVLGNLNAIYYLGHFYIKAGGTLASRFLASDTGEITHSKASYMFGGGWSNSHWNVHLTLNNIFNKNWNGDWSDRISPLYSSCYQSRSGEARRQLNINISYTFDYGKKVQHDNELNGQVKGNSAILK